jgi:hypothetical protein
MSKQRMGREQIVKGMYGRAVEGESSKRMALSYVARRLNFSINQTRWYLNSLNRKHRIAAYFDKKSVVFVGSI